MTVLGFACGPERVELSPSRLVIAGWTGRDAAAVQHHIAELAALGVEPPSQTPLYYRGSVSLLTQAERIQVVGAETSGEAEVVLLGQGGALYLTLGSDHTDRAAEAVSVALSKQLCPKPLARAAWRYNDVAGHLDQLILRSWIGVERVLYQEGPLAEILPPAQLLEGAGSRDSLALFCGTLPARGGVRPALRFEMELEDPVLGRRIGHAYTIEVLDLIA